MVYHEGGSTRPSAGAIGHAVCRGAFTIINGIATGNGGACGVDLRLMARFELTDKPGEVGFRALGPLVGPGPDDSLARACIAKLLTMTGQGDSLGAHVETVSEIPSSRGLKSSSAAANAIIMAGLNALGRDMEPLDVVQMGVDCCMDAGVTLTGAFDDAVATMFGGAVLTDNEQRSIVSWPDVRDDLIIHFLVPQWTITKASLHREDFAPAREEVQRAFDLATAGDLANAITLNGRAYAPILGVDNGPADAALAAGAWAAGMTGTGPAIAVLCTVEDLEAVLAALAPFQGTLVRTGVNREPGRTLAPGEYADLRDEVMGGATPG